MSPMSWSWGEWTPLYPGVEQANKLSADVPFSAVPIPYPGNKPYQTINLLRVRMDDPHVTTYSTPQSGLSPDGVTVSQFLHTTFVAPSQVAIAGIVGINANFFDYPGPRNATAGWRCRLLPILRPRNPSSPRAPPWASPMIRTISTS